MKHIAAVFALAVLCAAPLRAQSPDSASNTPEMKTERKGKAPTLEAKLVDADAKAKKQSATVECKVGGLKLVDPGMVHEKPMKGQGHLHYRVDDGPVIATTATKLSFHELKPGAHTFTVMLAANDHSPLGPSQTLNVTVP
ncbi:MAG TPA: hypothetical protein VN915_14780 [Elusimicrobiota bacterium]|nr:hypothetical protein [Elusimicrobiota bacterium]